MLAFVALLTALASPAAPQAEHRDQLAAKLQHELQRLAAATPGVVGIAVFDIVSGKRFGVSPLDVGTFAAMAAVFAVVAAIASYLPAQRAASRDPVSALRGD